MNQERLLIEMSGESQLELWKETYDIGDSYEINGEIYTSIEELNSLKHSHSSSIDFIVQRKSDGLYFRFNVWCPDGKNWRCDDERLEQVFQTTKRDSKLKKNLA